MEDGYESPWSVVIKIPGLYVPITAVAIREGEHIVSPCSVCLVHYESQLQIQFSFALMPRDITATRGQLGHELRTFEKAGSTVCTDAGRIISSFLTR